MRAMRSHHEPHACVVTMRRGQVCICVHAWSGGHSHGGMSIWQAGVVGEHQARAAVEQANVAGGTVTYAHQPPAGPDTANGGAQPSSSAEQRAQVCGMLILWLHCTRHVMWGVGTPANAEGIMGAAASWILT